MKLDTKLSDLQVPLSLCLKCVNCAYGEWPESSPLCPIYCAHHVYTASAAGLISFLKVVIDGRTDYTPTIADLAYECTTCGICNVCEVVPVFTPHVWPTDVIRFLRYQLVKRELIPGGIKEVYRQVKEKGDYLGDNIKLEVPEKVKDDRADTVLFIEPIYAESQRAIYESAIRLLEKTGKRVIVFDNEGGSCGSILYNLGFWDELAVLIKKRAEQMKRLRDKEVLFIDPHCQEFMVKRYPEIEPAHQGFTAKHFSEFLVAAFKQGKLSTKGKQSIKVSYHDPCFLGRGLGIYEAPREVISFLPGVELVEMKRNRKNAYCCGAGGGGRGQAFPDFSKGVAEERLKEFEETGADLLITSCPYCKDAFQRILPKQERRQVRDLTEFVDEMTS